MPDLLWSKVNHSTFYKGDLSNTWYYKSLNFVKENELSLNYKWLHNFTEWYLFRASVKNAFEKAISKQNWVFLILVLLYLHYGIHFPCNSEYYFIEWAFFAMLYERKMPISKNNKVIMLVIFTTYIPPVLFCKYVNSLLQF